MYRSLPPWTEGQQDPKIRKSRNVYTSLFVLDSCQTANRLTIQWSKFNLPCLTSRGISAASSTNPNCVLPPNLANVPPCVWVRLREHAALWGELWIETDNVNTCTDAHRVIINFTSNWKSVICNVHKCVKDTGSIKIVDRTFFFCGKCSRWSIQRNKCVSLVL